MPPAVKLAALTVGIRPGSAYHLRSINPAFAKDWDAAMRAGRAAVRAAKGKRGLAPTRRRRTAVREGGGSGDGGSGAVKNSGWTAAAQAAFLARTAAGEGSGAICRALGLSTASLSQLYARAPGFLKAVTAAERQAERALLAARAEDFRREDEEGGLVAITNWRSGGERGPLTRRCPRTGRTLHRGSFGYLLLERERPVRRDFAGGEGGRDGGGGGSALARWLVWGEGPQPETVLPDAVIRAVRRHYGLKRR